MNGIGKLSDVNDPKCPSLISNANLTYTLSNADHQAHFLVALDPADIQLPAVPRLEKRVSHPRHFPKIESA